VEANGKIDYGHLPPRVVIVGAGFGGLSAAQTLGRAKARITVIDRKNYHTFQPLLYQVATAGLSPGEIAAPVRSILSSHKNVEVLMDEVTGFDLNRSKVQTPDGDIPYDYLIVAAGASHAYFGHEDWEPFAPGLKTIEDALEIRRRVLLAFELAERQVAAGATSAPLNFVVVGGGPTGVELAGTLAEISRHALAHEYRAIDPKMAHILLLEGGPRVLRRSVAQRSGTTPASGCGGAHFKRRNSDRARRHLCRQNSAVGHSDSVGRRCCRLAPRQKARRAGGSCRARAGAEGFEPSRPS
jgi:NADH dehydrogenase FAD-containing subunit